VVAEGVDDVLPTGYSHALSDGFHFLWLDINGVQQ